MRDVNRCGRGFVLHRQRRDECRLVDAERLRDARARRGGKRRPRAQLCKHGARLDRGQLVLVAEQHEPRTRRERIEQMRGERNVDHRRLVDDDQVVRQRIVSVMPEAGRPAAAQQPVQRERRLRQARREFGRQVAGPCVQCFLHPLRGLAGRRGQRDAQPRMRVEQTGQHADDGRRLARARATADDRHAARQRDDRRDALPVDFAGCRPEVTREAVAQPVGRETFVRRGHTGLRDERIGKPPFVVEIARQVQVVVAVDDQRPLVAACERAECDHAARGERRADFVERCFVALRERAERDAYVAARGRATRRERGARRPPRGRGRRTGATSQIADAAREPFRECNAEIGGFGQPRDEAAGKFERVVLHVHVHARPPSIIRSSASTSARSGRRACTPAGSPPLRQPGRTPRTNRYR